jgi:2-dehydropantoate 2-reductase
MTHAPVLMLGSGAMACFFAARLAASGQRVRMLASWQPGLEALQSNGACLEEADGTRHCYPVEASRDPAQFQGASLALVLVKSWQTERAAQQLAQCLHPQGLALTLQNGLGNLETLAAALGKERVYAGANNFGVTQIQPGCVRLFGRGEIILPRHPHLTAVFDMFNQAGLQTHMQDDIDAILWGKLLINAAVNPLSALLGVPNGRLLESAYAHQLMQNLVTEAARVVAALGIHLPYPDPLARVEEVVRATAENRTSMLQDILRGSPTEIEAITGALIRFADAYGIDVPTNRTLYLLIKSRELNPIKKKP